MMLKDPISPLTRQCSSFQVPSLFQDNFDYGDIRRDFVHGVLTSDLLMKQIHCYVAREGYAARVADTRSYDSVRLVSYMHPIRSAIRILLIPVTARISLQGGHSLLSQMIIIPVALLLPMITLAVIDTSLPGSLLISPGHLM